MVVEFERAVSQAQVIPLHDAEGEDDAYEELQARAAEAQPKIKIESSYVMCWFASRDPSVTIVKLNGGSGYKVRGTYAEVSAKLEASGSLNSEN